MSTQALEFKSMLDDALFAHGLRKMEQGAQKTSGVITSSFSKAGAAMAGALTFGALAAATKSLINFGSEIQDTSDRLNISVEAVQGLGYAFGQSGASQQDFEKGMVKLNQSLDDARSGNEKAISAFDKLGLKWEDIATKSPEQILLLIADGMKNAKNPTEALAAVMDILGKSGARMVPGLRAGADAIRELASEINKLDAEDIKVLDDAGDLLSRMGNQAKVASSEILLGLKRIWDHDFKSDLPVARSSSPTAAGDMPEDPRAKAAKAEENRLLADLAKFNKEREKLDNEAFANYIAGIQKEMDAEREMYQRISDAINETASVRTATDQDAMSDTEKLADMERERLVITKAIVTAKGEELAQLDLYLAKLDRQIAKQAESTKIDVDASIRRSEPKSKFGAKLGGFATTGGMGLQSGGLKTGSNAGTLLASPGSGMFDFSGVSNLYKAHSQTPTLSLAERRAAENVAVAGGEERKGSTASASNVIRRGDRNRAREMAKEEERKKLTVQGTNERLDDIILLLGDNAGPVK